MAKAKEQQPAIEPKSIASEITATQVVSAVVGVGSMEADLLLSEVSEQDRRVMVEAYSAGRVNDVYAILSKERNAV